MIANPEVAIGIEVNCGGLAGCLAPCQSGGCAVTCWGFCTAACVTACAGTLGIATATASGTAAWASNSTSSNETYHQNRLMNNSGLDKYVEHAAAWVLKWFT